MIVVIMKSPPLEKPPSAARTVRMHRFKQAGLQKQGSESDKSATNLKSRLLNAHLIESRFNLVRCNNKVIVQTVVPHYFRSPKYRLVALAYSF
jgi:hypothetical protein